MSNSWTSMFPGIDEMLEHLDERDNKHRCNLCWGKGQVTIEGHKQPCAMCKGSGSVAHLKQGGAA